MSRGKLVLALGIVAAAMSVWVSQAMSQESRPREGGRRGGGEMSQTQGDRGERMQQMRQRMEERMKSDLGVTDEEWKALQPKIEKVMTLSRDVRGPMMGMGGRGGRGGRGGGEGEAQSAPQSGLQKQQQALRAVLDKQDAKPAEIKTALRDFRDARAKARAELEKAQKDLRGVVTIRQEAQLVMMGVLD